MNFYSRIQFYLILLLGYMAIWIANGYDKEMTVHVDAGRSECFFQQVQQGESFDIEYQVIDGGQGDFDINFILMDPMGDIINKDYKRSENSYRHYVEKTGDYRFCFDNSFSTFNRKTVFFDLIIEKEGEQNLGDNQWNNVMEGLTPEDYYEMKVQDVMDYVARIRMLLTKARQLQDLLRSHETRDRNLAETNFNKVNNWSLFQICAMISVGFLQVYLVRSIFETDTRMSKLLQKMSSL